MGAHIITRVLLTLKLTNIYHRNYYNTLTIHKLQRNNSSTWHESNHQN